MRLTILHVPDCPNAATLQDRLTQAMPAGDVELALRMVDSEELAAELGMTGSPTLLVDGVDPFAEPGRSASVSCRLYRDDSGHLAGAPSVAELRRVLGPARAKAALADWRARTAPRDPAARAVHQAILRAFAATGRPPGPSELNQIAATHGATAEKILSDLHGADVIRLDPAGQIRVAYPFSATPTRHRVQLADGAEVWAMCAIDALGMPAMLAADAVITSSDPVNGEAVTITVHDGRCVWQPSTAVAFLSASAGDGPSAESCCNELNFFTTPANANAWMLAQPHRRGDVLDQGAAERLGTQVFGTLLRPDQDPVDEVTTT